MPTTWKFWQKRRFVVIFMAFLGFCNVYTLRVNLSVGIVAMTENRTVHYDNGTVGYVSQLFKYIISIDHFTRTLIAFISGTTFRMEFEGTGSNFKFILLRLHYDTIHWRIFRSQDWWKSSVRYWDICNFCTYTAHTISGR